MAVMIRLSRGGAKNQPFFNVVVTDKANRRDGNYLASIGYYNPRLKEAKDKLKIDHVTLKYWLSKGAKCSETVGRLLKATPQA